MLHIFINKITAVTSMQGAVNFQRATSEDMLTGKPERQVIGCLSYLRMG